MTINRNFRSTAEIGTQTTGEKFLNIGDVGPPTCRRVKADGWRAEGDGRRGHQTCETVRCPQMYNYGNPVFTCDKDIVGRYCNGKDLQEESTWEWGYPHKRTHPLYKTTNSNYGAIPPSIYTMPATFHPARGRLFDHLAACGMYRNRSLNTALDKTRV